MERTLVSIAVSSFAGDLAERPLPFATELRRALVAATNGLGYVDGTASDREDLTSREIGDIVGDALHRATIRARLGSPPVLIVHVLSHGDEHLNQVRVIGSDGTASAATGLDFWIANAFSPPGREQEGAWVLFLVDVCGAGAATTQSWQVTIADEYRRVWVIAGCLPERPGFNGRFTRAAAHVLSNLSSLDIAPSLRYVPLPPIAQAIRREVNRLSAGGFPQRVVSTRVDIATEIDWPPFFDNPNYGHSLADRAPFDLREFVSNVDSLVDPWHFATRAAGLTPEYDRPLNVGYFHGRTVELSALSGWLSSPTGHGALRVVTGSPGVGKSALLGLLVCAAHPRLSRATEALWTARRDDLPRATIPNLVAVHAREQDVRSIVASIARQANLGIGNPSPGDEVKALKAALENSDMLPVIVIDAVDEAVNPSAVINLIEDLRLTLRVTVPACRLLVGTRSGPNWRAVARLVEQAALNDGLIDLDTIPRPQLRADLTRYVDDLLRGRSEYAGHDYLPARSAIAETVARRLTESASVDEAHWGEFLVAGIFARYLANQPAVRDPTLAAIRADRVPRTLAAVLELDLTQRAHPWVRPVLACLAYAFGAGMPRILVAACASVFATTGLGEPTEIDVDTAFAQVQFYLRRDVDVDGVSIYRLFHQGLIDSLRKATLGSSGRGRVAANHRSVLSRLCASAGEGGWAEQTIPYVLRHAIDHAAEAGTFDGLLTDAEFLVHADSATLMRRLPLATTRRARQAEKVYRRSWARHHDRDSEERRSILAVDASRYRFPDLLDRLCRPPNRPALPWRPRWVTPDQTPDGSRHPLRSSLVAAVAHARIDDATGLAISAHWNGAVSVWDMSTGEPRHSLVGHTDVVWAAACIRLADNTPAAVTASDDGTARVWDLSTGRARHTLTGHRGGVLTVTCVRLGDGTAAAITSSLDGTARVWDLADGRMRWTLNDAAVAVAVARLGAHLPIAVTTNADGTARVWDLTNGQILHTLLGHDHCVASVACIRLGDGTPATITTGYDGTARVWDLTDGRIRHTLIGHNDKVNAVACIRLSDGSPLAVTTCYDGSARVWDLDHGRLRHVLTGHTQAVRAVGCVRLDDGTRVAVTTSYDRTARTWNLTTGECQQVIALPDVPSVVMAVTRGQFLIAFGPDVACFGKAEPRLERTR